MGGMNSEIKEDTTTILIESANFNGDGVRATSKKLGLRTEALLDLKKALILIFAMLLQIGYAS